ncbi:MAG: tRNA-guanine transglycosylase, partial [Candidatus Hydrothermarchaeaceae archaeon]
MGAVVQGSKYIGLRKKCAGELCNRPLLAIADGHKLLNNPRLTVEVVTAVREAISPNTAVYFPFAPPHMFYILAYMGVDIFDSSECIVKAVEGKLLTGGGVLDLAEMREIPCSCEACIGKSPREFKKDNIFRHNFNTTTKVMKEIREGIRKNRLAEVVEGRASFDTKSMAMLRILNSKKCNFLEKYTSVG